MTSRLPVASDLAGADPRFPDHLHPATLRFQLASPQGDLWARAQAAAQRVSGRYAIVRSCGRRRSVPGLPPLSVYYANGPRRTPSGHPLHVPDVNGMSVSESDEESRLKAIVETVERYCFGLPHEPGLLFKAPYEQVERWALSPESFQIFSEAQYRALPGVGLPGASEAIDWTWAYSLTRNRFALVPAALVYPSVPRQPPNNFIDGVVSTGTACHVSLEAAILAGLLEVMERDAIMVSWLHRRVPAVIEAMATPELAQLLQRYFRLPDFEFVLVDLTLDAGIPTVACVALSDHPSLPAVVMGAAARTDPLTAARKALFEAAQMLHATHDLGWKRSDECAISEVGNLADHGRFFAGASGPAEIDFLVSSSSRVTLDELPDAGTGSPAGDLATCVTRLAELGLEVLVVDLTSDDVARCGLRVVRVLVPRAVDIYGDMRYPRLGSDRIQVVPAQLGWPTLTEAELNMAPCPMA